MAVNNMAGAVVQMASTFNSATGDLATPRRRSKAVKAVVGDESLSREDRVKAIRLFTADIAMCDSYLAIDDEDLRNDFIRSVI